MDESLSKLKASDFSFSAAVRLSLFTADHWNEKQLEALCCGIPPGKYGDRDDVLIARSRISAAIKSGALYAEPNPNAGDAAPIYGGLWLIEPAHAVRWVLFQIPPFREFPEWLAGGKFREICAMQDAEKLAEGRYSLQEAAKLIAEKTGEHEEVICEKLKGAAERYELSMYEPGKNTTMEYGQGKGKSSRVRTFYEECFWGDLNKWLAEKQPRIDFRFARPKGKSLPPNGRVIVEELAHEIAQFQTDNSASPWKEHDGDDDMRRTIVTAMNQHGWESSESKRIGALPLIYKLFDTGQIALRSTLNDFPPIDWRDVVNNTKYWYMTTGDADVVRAVLIGTSAAPLNAESLPASPAGVPVLSSKPITHKIRNRAAAILTAEIIEAKTKTPQPDSLINVWNELTKLAEAQFGVMIGFSSDGIQYRGRQYQLKQVPDVFTRKNLRERMAREAVRRRV